MKFIKMLCVGASLCLAGCFTSAPRYTVDMEAEAVSVPYSASAEAMKEAIAKAAAEREWCVVKSEDGLTELLLDVRGKHELVVDVHYTADTFRIAYVSSKNLDYNPQTKGIHGKYLQWVRNLKHEIRLHVPAK